MNPRAGKPVRAKRPKSAAQALDADVDRAGDPTTLKGQEAAVQGDQFWIDYVLANPTDELSDSLCQARWAEAEAEADPILQESDVIERNRKISAAYAESYQQDQNLEWFGTAAFASKQVGCGMKHAKEMQESFLVNNPPGTWVEPRGREFADKTLEKLGDGNEAVFKEMYPIERFYQAHGNEALQACGAAREPQVPEKILEGFDLAHRASVTGDPQLRSEAALTMLENEQNVTLQRAAYDDPVFRDALKANQRFEEGLMPTFGMSQPTRVVFDAACQSKGAPAFEMTGGNLGDPEWRWKYASGTANKFSELTREQPGAIQEGINGIIEAGR